MALSGTLTVNGYDGRNYYMTWTATQNVSTNSSTINWEISCAGGGSDWYAERTGKCTIAGQTVWNKTERVQRYAGTIKTGSLTIQHNANGNASFTASMTVSIYDADFLYTNSATFTLDRIYRGVAYVYDGTSFKEHSCYIYTNGAWAMYQPYIYTNGSWQMY